MAKAYFRIKIWEEVTIDSNVPEEYIKKLFSLGLIKASEDLWAYISHNDIQWEEYIDGEHQINLDENKGFSTMELHDHLHNMIWENGKSNI